MHMHSLNKLTMKTLFTSRTAAALVAWLALTASVSAQAPRVAGGDEYSMRVVARGLHRPTGIVVRGDKTIYFTEVPTPGVNAMNGGSNAVSRLDLRDDRITTLHMGEPEPVNLALGRDGALYWTCKSAGVILEQEGNGPATVFLSGLNKPSGIAVDRHENVYYTEVPTPGVNAMNGGSNSVSVSDGRHIELIHQGEPEPTDIVVSRDGDLYWTCQSAGVIFERDPKSGLTTVLIGQLDKPTGIALDARGKTLFFTEVPTPGVSGRNGGRNKIWELDLKTGVKKLVDEGDPEPTDITVARNGNLYWTCTSAGVIVEAIPARK